MRYKYSRGLNTISKRLVCRVWSSDIPEHEAWCAYWVMCNHQWQKTFHTVPHKHDGFAQVNWHCIHSGHVVTSSRTMMTSNDSRTTLPCRMLSQVMLICRTVGVECYAVMLYPIVWVVHLWYWREGVWPSWWIKCGVYSVEALCQYLWVYRWDWPGSWGSTGKSYNYMVWHGMGSLRQHK